MMPLTIKSSKLPVAALYPKSGFASVVTRYDDRAVVAGVGRDEPHGVLERALDDVRA